jgi:acyl-CoA thioesterase FadM
VSPVITVSDRVRWGDVDFARIVRYDAFSRFYDADSTRIGVDKRHGSRR